MNWFTRTWRGLLAAERASELAQDCQTQRERVEALAGMIDELTEALEAQQRDSAQLLTEWATTLDKISRWASRQSARERRDTHAKLDTLAGIEPENGAGPAQDVRSMSKTQLRALAARQRRGGNVAVDEGQ